MKKFLTLIITFIFCAVNATYAFSELYYVKNIKTNTMKPIIEDSFAIQGYNIQKENPFYGTNKDGDYVVVIVQQSGNNLFYYYNSKQDTKIHKAILKYLRRMSIEYEQSMNANIIDIYDKLAQNTLSSLNKTYNFDEPAVQSPQPVYDQSQSLKGYVAQLSEGTKINAYLQNAINTSTAAEGDKVLAVVTSDLKHRGVVIAPQGSVLYGTLTKARHATYGSRNGRVVINFNQLVTPENKVYNITTEEIDFTVTNDGKIGSTVQKAALGAVVGALTGLLFAAIGDANLLSGAAIGAGVGAGAYAAGSAIEKGIDAEIPSFTEMEITLTRPLSVSVSY